MGFNDPNRDPRAAQQPQYANSYPPPGHSIPRGYIPPCVPHQYYAQFHGFPVPYMPAPQFMPVAVPDPNAMMPTPIASEPMHYPGVPNPSAKQSREKLEKKPPSVLLLTDPASGKPVELPPPKPNVHVDSAPATLANVPQPSKPLVLMDPTSGKPVELRQPGSKAFVPVDPTSGKPVELPSRPLSKNVTPNTTHDSESVVAKMPSPVKKRSPEKEEKHRNNLVGEMRAKFQQVNGVPSEVKMVWGKPVPVPTQKPTTGEPSKLVTPPPVARKLITAVPVPIGPGLLKVAPPPAKVEPVPEKSEAVAKKSVKEECVSEKPVEPKTVAKQPAHVVPLSKKAARIAAKKNANAKVEPVPKKKPEEAAETPNVVEPVPKKPVELEIVAKEKPAEKHSEPFEAPAEETEAVTDPIAESASAEVGLSLFDAPDGFGDADQISSAEDVTVDDTADEDDDGESMSGEKTEEEDEQLLLERAAKEKRRQELNEAYEKFDKGLGDTQRYNRGFMYFMRDMETEFNLTRPPLPFEQIVDFGLDLASMPLQPQRSENYVPRDKSYQQKTQKGFGRNSHNGSTFRQKSGSYQNRGGVISRNSIERAPKVDLKNKAVNAWKAYKIKPEDMEKEEIRIELLLKQVRSLLNKITPTYKEELIGEFLKLNVSGPAPAFDAPEEQLARVIIVIFDKAVEEPRFCSLYAEICKRQVESEIRVSRGPSRFRNSILTRAQLTFVNKTMDAEKEAIDQEADENRKKELMVKYEEDFVKFRRRKFGNINFIGQLYDQALLSSKIIQWCFYDLLRSSYPDKETHLIPEPPFDEESLQCATQLLEAVGKNFETAKDFNQAGEYIKQTVDHLVRISASCSPKIKFKIMGVKELKDQRWRPRKVVEQGPKKISEIHQEIMKEQQQLNQDRDAYDRKQSNAGFRQNASSIPRQAPPSRGSQDARIGQMKRASAAFSATKAPASASPRQLSLTNIPRRSNWASGASGGGNHESPGSRQIKQRDKDKESALSAVRNMAKDTSKNVKQATVLTAEEQEKLTVEKLEWEEKLKKLPSRIKSDLNEIEQGVAKIEEFTEDMFKATNTDKYNCDIFSCFAESCAQNINEPKTLELAGQIIRSCLKKPKLKTQIFVGIERYCKKAVEESLSEDFPKLWNNLGLVIVKLLQYEQPVQDENADPAVKTSSDAVSLSQFGPIFLAASSDSSQKRYDLLVATLKKLVETLPADSADELEGLRFDFEDLCEKQKFANLDGSLKACNVDLVGYNNLFEALNPK